MDKIILEPVNEVHVKVNTTQNILYDLQDHFSFKVPNHYFHPKYKARMWDGTIKLFQARNQLLYRGLLKDLEKFCEKRNIEIEATFETGTVEFSLDEAKIFADRVLKNEYVPRDYQLTAFAKSIRNKRKLLLSPTASGKSLIIFLLCRYLVENFNAKILILVPTTSLVEQLYGDFEDYAKDWSVSDNCHRVYAGKEKAVDKKIVISTWQSLYKLDVKYFSQYQAVIGDECHLFKAKSLTDIMVKLVNAAYRIGTTGTLDGSHTNKMVLEGLFGEVSDITTTKKLMDDKHISPFEIKCLVLKHTESARQVMKRAKYIDEIKYLIENRSRNKFIENLALSLEGNTMILYQYVDKHGKLLYEDLTAKKSDDRNVYFVHGGISAEDREAIRHKVESDTNAIIVASYQTFSTGINIQNLHNIIFASPSKSRIRNLQSIGRGLRKSEKKDIAVLYDIADDLIYGKSMNTTYGHFKERIKIYKEQEFEFKVYPITLKE